MCNEQFQRIAGLAQAMPRGEILLKAHEVINGERQDTYGNPEDSFALISEYWTIYIGEKMLREAKSLSTGPGLMPTIDASDVAIMMVLFKVARQANQHKVDNLIDAAGYLGIAADLNEEPEPAGPVCPICKAEGEDIDWHGQNRYQCNRCGDRFAMVGPGRGSSIDPLEEHCDPV